MKLLTLEQTRQLLENGRATQQASAEMREPPDHRPVVKLFTPDAACTWLLSNSTRKRRTSRSACAAPGVLGDYLDDIAKPASRTEDLASSSSEQTDSASSVKMERAKEQASRASKHHVSLYITPGVDRAMKRTVHLARSDMRRT